jgi:two-component system phosphate regulon sensor histidine kinase PhoR
LIHRPGEVINKQARVLHRDGSWRWMDGAAKNLLNDPGVRAIVVNFHDISERKQAEEVLKESEARYRGLFDSMPIGLFRSAPAGWIIDANPALVQLLGYPDLESLLAINLDDVYLNRSQTRAAWYALAEREGVVLGFEAQVRRRDGSIIWIRQSGRAIRDAEGRVLYYEGAAEDITELKQADAAVRASQRLLTALLLNSREIITILDEESGIIYESPSVRRILGWEPRDMIGRSLLAFIHPDDIPHIVDKITQTMARPDATVISEARFKRANGQWLYLEGIGQNMLDDPAVRGIVVVSRDIAERKQRQHELEAIVRMATALRAVATFDEMLAVVADQVMALLGAPGAALVMRERDGSAVITLARGRLSRLAGERLAPDEGISARVIATGQPYLTNDIAHDLLAARPQLVGDLSVAACVPLIAQQETIGALWVGSDSDISRDEMRLLMALGDIAANALQRAQIVDTLEQRVAERTEELEHERARIQAILDAAGEGISLREPDLTIAYVNPALEQMTGYTAAELMGQKVHWQSELTSELVYEEMNRTLERGEAWQGEVINRRKDGTAYDAILTINPLHDAEGNVVGYVGVQRDITRLKELDRLKSKFVSDVSHELRTPVTNLKLYVDLLERGRPEKREHYMGTLREQAERLAQLVEDILNLSRLEMAEESVKFAPVDLNSLVEPIVITHQPSAAAAGLTLARTLEPGLPPVLGERNQLAQVITNLIINAINYTPAGEINIRLRSVGNHVCLEVQDTGVGIPADDLPHLFDRFYRGKQAAGSDIRGTGLGLAIVKEIVSLHRGWVEVESQIGSGSAFRVYLPIAQDV